MRRLFGLAVLLFSFSLSQLAYAQTLPPTSSDDLMGMFPYQSYHGGDIDSIRTSSTASVAFRKTNSPTPKA